MTDRIPRTFRKVSVEPIVGWQRRDNGKNVVQPSHHAEECRDSESEPEGAGTEKTAIGCHLQWQLREWETQLFAFHPLLAEEQP